MEILWGTWKLLGSGVVSQKGGSAASLGGERGQGAMDTGATFYSHSPAPRSRKWRFRVT